MGGNINKVISDNIQAIITQRYAENQDKIDINKMINQIRKSFHIEIDENLLSDILSNHPNVQSIENGQIVLGTAKEQDEESVEEDIHDTAVDQIDDHMKFESVIDILTKCKVGDTIKSSKVKLNESDEHYHLHYGSKKANRNYIVCEIKPKRNINESYLKCKIEGTALYINIPVNSLLK